MPFQVIVGEKGLRNKQVEIKRRATSERMMVAIDDIVQVVKKLLNE
jgi:histidyl-tRNA synthetase